MGKPKGFVGALTGKEDIVTWILRKVCDRAPGAASAGLLEVEQETRQHWGGARPYIAKRAPIASNGKVPRRTYYRWAVRKRSEG